MTKEELLDKLVELAERWDRGGGVDPYDTGACTDTVLAYVSACADSLRELIVAANEE